MDRRRLTNRLHLDPHVSHMEAEVARLLALGASEIRVEEDEDGDIWTVMADPEGNEFCVAA